MTLENKTTGQEVLEIPLERIKVNNGRYRKDLGDIQTLADSIATVGQLVPIIVGEDYTLIAGERRFRAYQLINELAKNDKSYKPKLTIRGIIESRKDIDNRIIEILENLERKDFTWQEQVLAMDDLHAMLKGSHKKWSETKTAKKAGLSASGVITDLNLAEVLKADPEIFKGCKTKNAALKALQKYKIDETMAEIKLRKESTNYGKKAKNHVFLGDCNKLIDSLPKGVVNALISDPFYGIDINKVKKFNDNPAAHQIYEDSAETYFRTITELVVKADRVMNENSWVCMFCRVENFYWLREQWENIGFKMDSIPGIWYRTGSSGQTNNPDKWFARSYEVFVYGYRGDISLIRSGQSNILQFHGVPPTEKDHPVQKPLALMEELISRFCLPGHVILDPMCGSGTTLVAAIKRACNPIGFEIDERNYNAAILNVADILNMKDAGEMGLVK